MLPSLEARAFSSLLLRLDVDPTAPNLEERADLTELMLWPWEDLDWVELRWRRRCSQREKGHLDFSRG